MKPIVLLTVVGLSFSNVMAQWSEDPAAPLVVCDAAHVQSGVRALADGNGGWYVFWMDRRLDGYIGEVYGQRYDAGGNALWTSNGKPIMALAGETVLEFAVTTLDNGELLLAYIHEPAIFQDTLSAMALDGSGNAAWDQATNITASGPSILGPNAVSVIPSPGGAIIGWYDNYIGGSNGVNVTRILNDGSLPWGTDGYAIPGAYYGPFQLFNEGMDGVLVQWRTGNGSGAHLFAMRVGLDGANAWADSVNTSMGGTGLNYAFNSVLTDEGALITTWRNMIGHLDMARLNVDGTLPWGNTPTVLCDYASSQDLPVICRQGDEYVIAFSDNRPPASNADLYVQRITGDGQLLWDVDGLPGLQANTYIPTPGLVPSTNGAVVVTFDANVIGFCAQRILDDGSQAWPAPVIFCTPAFNPFYADQVKLPDGSGGVVAFWSNNDQVYAAHIDVNGQLGDHTGVNGPVRTDALLRVLPSVTEGPMSVLLPGGLRPKAVRAWDALGRATPLSIIGAQGDRILLDASELADGLYVLEVTTDAGALSARFEVAR